MNSRRWIWAFLYNLLGPGAGHIFMKYRMRGWLWMGSTGVFILVAAFHIFLRIQAYQASINVQKTADPVEALVRSSQLVSSFFNNSSGLMVFYSAMIGLIFIASYLDLGYLFWRSSQRIDTPGRDT